MFEQQIPDYGAIARSGMSSVPDYAAQEAQRQQLAIQKQQASNEQQKFGMQVAAAQKEDADEDAFQDDLAGVMTNPSAQSIIGLMVKHPNRAKQIKEPWEMQETVRKDSDFATMADVYGATRSGNYDVAAKVARARVDADKAAGQSDPMDEHIAAALESGDPVQMKAVEGLIGFQLAAINPDKYKAAYGGSENKVVGRSLVSNDGNVIYRDPEAPQFREVKSTDANGNETVQIVRVGGEGGGGPASTGGGGGSAAPLDPSTPQGAVANTLTGANFSPAVVAGFMGNFEVEGGFGGAKGDGGSAHGIAQWRGERRDNFVRQFGKEPSAASHAEQGKFVVWEMQNPEAAGMTVAQRDKILAAKTPAQAAALVDQYYERSSGQHRSRRLAAANRFAGGGGASSGSATSGNVVFTATGSKKPGYRMLTPSETAAQGLDPNVKYQESPTGQITALGGQPKPQNLKPWPAPALKDWAINKSATSSILPAMKLFDPNNKSPEALRAQKSIGTGTGYFGDTYTQFADPKGTKYRSMIGRIGGIIIKEQSGAAVSISEDQRLAKWVPLVTDRPEVAHDKLKNLFVALNNDRQSMEQTYTTDQGFRAAPGGGGGAPMRVRSLQEALKLPKGTEFINPRGQKQIR